MTGRNDPTSHLDLADEIAMVLATLLERPGEMPAFLAGERSYLVRFDGVRVFDEAPIGTGTVPGSGAN